MRENGAVRRGIQHIRECLRALLLRVLIGKGGDCSGAGRLFLAGEGDTRAYVRIIYNIAKFV